MTLSNSAESQCRHGRDGNHTLRRYYQDRLHGGSDVWNYFGFCVKKQLDNVMTLTGSRHKPEVQTLLFSRPQHILWRLWCRQMLII